MSSFEKCPRCGGLVAPGAMESHMESDACSRGGTAQWDPQEKGSGARTAFGVFVFFALALAVALLATKTGPDVRSQSVKTSTAESVMPLTADLDAFVDVQDGQIVVRNRDSFDWVDVKIALNPGVLRGGWSLPVARIPSGSEWRGGLMAFTKGGGQRFDPFTHAVEHVSISCYSTEPDHGRGFWYGGYPR